MPKALGWGHFNGLRSATGNLNHLGIKTAPSKSSISYQNGKRDADLFKDVYFKLLEQLGQSTRERKTDKTQNKKVPVCLLDSTLFLYTCLCWIGQHIEQKRRQMKMHTLLEYDREASCL